MRGFFVRAWSLEHQPLAIQTSIGVAGGLLLLGIDRLINLMLRGSPLGYLMIVGLTHVWVIKTAPRASDRAWLAGIAIAMATPFVIGQILTQKILCIPLGYLLIVGLTHTWMTKITPRGTGWTLLAGIYVFMIATLILIIAESMDPNTPSVSLWGGIWRVGAMLGFAVGANATMLGVRSLWEQMTLPPS